jgi:hypothetical protein
VFDAGGDILASAFLANIDTALVNGDTALATALTGLSAQFTSVDDALTVTNSNLTNNYYTQADTDSAIATADLVLASRLDDAEGDIAATEANLNNNYYTFVQTDSAIAAAKLTLDSRIDGVDNDIDAVSDEVIAVQANLSNNYYTAVTVDSAIANSALTLNSRMDGISGDIDTTDANLSNNYYTITGADSAIAAAKLTLDSRIDSTNGNVNNLSSNLSNNYYTIATADSAMAASTQALRAEVNNASYATNANITTNYYTRVQANSAISASVNTLEAMVFTSEGALSSGFTTQISSVVTDDISSYVTRTEALEATVDDGATGLDALNATVISNRQAIIDDTGGIISSTIDTYTVTRNGVTATLAQWAFVASDNELAFTSQWGVKTDVAGLVGGVGFYNDGSVTRFTVDATNFSVINSAGDGVVQLLKTSAGVAGIPDGVYIDNAFIKTADIRELVAGVITVDKLEIGSTIEAPIIIGGTVRAAQLELLGPNTMFVTSPTPFGPNNLIEWKGPKIIDGNGNPILSQLTKSNAKYWYDSSNNVYFSGTIIAGSLGTSNQDPSFTNTPSITTGNFASNGGQISILCSVFASFNTGLVNQSCPTPGPAPTAVLTLKRGDSTVRQEMYTGSNECLNEGNGQTISFESVNGSFTHFDNSNNTSIRNYTLSAIISNVRLLPNSKANRGLSIVTSEA